MSENLRFVVGETYTFARTVYERTDKDIFSPLYMPWLDKLTEIQVINLECVEHHKVGWEHAPDDKKYDGFFKDQDGNLWANQYPRASYGQLDDSGDRHVRRHFKDTELLATNAAGEFIKDAEGKHVIRDEALWAIHDDQFWKPYSLATSMLYTIRRAIDDDKDTFDAAQRVAFMHYMQQFILKIEEVSGKLVHFMPLTYRNKNTGELIVSKIYEAKLIDHKAQVQT
jgi:hypothetical protein